MWPQTPQSMIPRGKRMTPRLKRAVTYTEAMNALRAQHHSLRGIALSHPDPATRRQLQLLIDQLARLLDRDDGWR